MKKKTIYWYTHWGWLVGFGIWFFSPILSKKEEGGGKWLKVNYGEDERSSQFPVVSDKRERKGVVIVFLVSPWEQYDPTNNDREKDDDDDDGSVGDDDDEGDEDGDTEVDEEDSNEEKYKNDDGEWEWEQQ